MATLWTGAATARHNPVRQTLLASRVTAAFTFAIFPAELDQRDLVAARVARFFFRFTHICSFV